MNTHTPSFLEPIDLETFFSVYWEKQPLHIQRASSSTPPLIALSDIETVLSSQLVYFPGIQLTQSGKTIDVSSYTDDQNTILPLRLFEQHAQGATIVLSQAQKLFKALHGVCRDVTRSLQMRSQANVYLSPPGNQGFNAHYDTHDVFILQVSGAKTFNFYPSSVELPCHDESFDSSKLEAGVIDESVALAAGDTLYIPRGVVHDAVAHDKEPSLHVTLGVYPMLMRDLLQESIQMLAETDMRFRRSVDTYLHTSQGSDSKSLQQALLPLVQDLQASIESDADSVSQVYERFQDELSLDSMQDCVGLGRRNLSCDQSNASDVPFMKIRLRAEAVISFQPTSYGVKLRCFGQILEFHEPSSTIVRQLVIQGEVARADMQEVNSDQLNALIKRLLQENLIDLVN